MRLDEAVVEPDSKGARASPCRRTNGRWCPSVVAQEGSSAPCDVAARGGGSVPAVELDGEGGRK
jgi:hypothetical protein